WLLGLADAEEELDAEEVLRQINEERAAAAFPQVTDVALVEAALADRRRHYKDVTLEALDQAPSSVLVDALTRAVEQATLGGESPAPLLIEELASAYELRATGALERGAVVVRDSLTEVRKNAASGEDVVSNGIARLERAVR